MAKDKSEAILAKNLERDTTFPSEGPKNEQKIWNECQQDLNSKEKQASELDLHIHSAGKLELCSPNIRISLVSWLLCDSILLHDGIVSLPTTEEARKERIWKIGANKKSWKSRTKDFQQEIQMLTK